MALSEGFFSMRGRVGSSGAFGKGGNRVVSDCGEAETSAPRSGIFSEVERPKVEPREAGVNEEPETDGAGTFGRRGRTFGDEGPGELRGIAIGRDGDEGESFFSRGETAGDSEPSRGDVTGDTAAPAMTSASERISASGR